MQVLKTVLLQHRVHGGDHYDWMIEMPATPTGPDDKLLTWRLILPSWHWQQVGRSTGLHLQELRPHRRAYLHRTGVVSGRRGVVHRVDAGAAVVRQWHDDGGYLDLTLRHFTGRVLLRRQPAMRWRLCVVR